MTEKQDAEMVDAEEESSDSDSDFEEVEVSEEDMGAISTLESELEANPNLYDKHVEVHALSEPMNVADQQMLDSPTQYQGR